MPDEILFTAEIDVPTRAHVPKRYIEYNFAWLMCVLAFVAGYLSTKF